MVEPKIPYLPGLRQQNPAPVPLEGQEAQDAQQALVSKILEAFTQVLPSNYVSQTTGPFYIEQFQAVAEQLAQVQITLEEVDLQSDVDFARPEFLWQMIGTLVFPETSKSPQGAPEISGDLSYREFLRRMLLLLLQGARIDTVHDGVTLLTDAEVRVLAKVAFSQDPTTAWGLDDQFELEINVLGTSTWEGEKGEPGTGFPTEPFVLLRNNQRILRALRPAHTLYEYRHLFLETFGPELFEDTFSAALTAWYYEDLRHYCLGMKAIVGAAGITLSAKTLFYDPNRSFGSVPVGATLTILSGPNTKPTSGGLDTATLGEYRVVEVRRLVSGADTTPRAYTTSPNGLSGSVTIDAEGVLTDAAQDFSFAGEGEILTILAGPNAASYRLETLMGGNGGPIGFVAPGSEITQVRVAPTVLRTMTRMPQTATGQSYTVTLQRKGCKHPWKINGEDVSAQFFA